jgi:hypothetical protein
MMKSHVRILVGAMARAVLCGLVLSGLTGLFAQHSVAALFTLTDENSIAQFDTATQANNFSWFVDGTNLLAQQAFWYRIGNAGPEFSLHTLPIGVQGTTDANFDGNPDTLFVRYNGAGFRAETRYSLDGGAPGSGTSDMGEQIAITNLLDSPLDFHFFQYANFDLSPADSALFTNANAVDQFGNNLRLSETVITPVSSHREIQFFPVTLNKLNDGLPTTLIDNAALGAGDVTWAFQWDVVIPAGSTFLISKDKRLVPEPAAVSLLSLAAGFLVARRRRRRLA